ncbi:3-hydroxybutyryl-CoA dehydrogenase [Bacillus subtilis subsp. subtilis]|uniref:Probable 3-hydroxybutyryl-CoA dehydrogenase n=3 Tax=Bacillus subtilis subsp. subtilis TaxID=135461 RepID=HBD_BACSU|nr:MULTISPECIES: 3-hydroxybutyryl-CoA dehydrogenase [Bacillales]NP_390296.2 3-hydroxybutyryl-CoA dehydrogenase [Bacillus subtilis subsp. subtilis str. 168]P45856.1 RecName: Full=Probable 3-hydroxybutyryl-CoA dehydrogenase; AltName: Full=Beta-hydroxybutyryl-CoA dehydrogenase; Short=BHBD [Bacillus subtilis subsp. subtilis str. 168]CJR92953.1 3-hydroxybutyryl-CoA dehydrogenase [Streptococcus pneumoniae]BAM52901.1 3-hydroxybutyryl-CoA dehydrogenase [Bacillus subtilis BEST7613]AAB09614.1 similar to
MEIKQIMVAGAGQMGSGIAQTAADAGFYVRMYDVNPEAAEAGLKRLKKQLARDAEKGKRTETEVKSVINRISISQTLEEAEHADIVIEAIAENMAAKTEMFKTLDRICPPHTILASNTSSLPITEIAAVTNRPQRVIGMHFMNPVPVMKLVEVIRGLATSEETALDVMALAEKMGKTAVEVNDFPGFVSNRVLLPMINEAIYCVYEGVAKPEAIDEVMKLGMNHPMGPLALADFIGLDTCLSIMEVLHSGLGDSKYRPCPLLRKYVKAGWLGKKSGRGFYDYEEKTS